MSPSEDTDVLAFEICAKLQQRYDHVATEHSSSGNIIGVFFHDLVIHFTGIKEGFWWYLFIRRV